MIEMNVLLLLFYILVEPKNILRLLLFFALFIQEGILEYVKAINCYIFTQF